VQKTPLVSPAGALLPLSAGSSASFGINASHRVKAMPFERQFGLLGQAFPAFGAPAGFLFRDKEPVSGQGNQTGTENQGAAGASVFQFPDGNHHARQGGTKFSTRWVRQPTIRPGRAPGGRGMTPHRASEARGTFSRCGSLRVPATAVRPSFLGRHRSRPPCSRQMRRSARLQALSTTMARRYPELRSPIGTLPGGSGVQLDGDTRGLSAGKPETRHGGCRPGAAVKQRPMELVWGRGGGK